MSFNQKLEEIGLLHWGLPADIQEKSICIIFKSLFHFTILTTIAIFLFLVFDTISLFFYFSWF